MNRIKRIPILRLFVREDLGQTLVFTAMIMVAFLGVTGIAVDAGKGYYAFEMLKASTNAAALAGAAGMPDTSTATTYADNYGSQVSAYNSNGVMTSVNTSVAFECLQTVTNDFYAGCENSTGGSTGSVYNAVQVTQTAKVPTWIGPLFGIPTFNIQDVSTASMKGGSPTPYNIAIILDTTASMTGGDDGKNNTSSCTTQIGCAELGIQTFLTYLEPGSTSSPIDQVSLYVFPGATGSSISNDYACNGKSPTSVPYTFSSATGLSSKTSTPTNYALPTGDTYNVLATLNSTTGAYTTTWSNDYKTTTSSTLNTSSNLVKAVGGKSGCGAGAPGGEGTYYASVIYQAGADLAAEHTANGNANMLIVLSDGNATACNSQSYPKTDCGNTNTEFQIYATNCPELTSANWSTASSACSGSYSGQPISGTFCAKSTGGPTYPNCGTSQIVPTGEYTATFPSAVGECGQAVVASQWVAALPDTVVYTIGYGSPTSGCTTDATYSYNVSSTYGANSWAPGDSPCDALGAMATNGNYFFSDNADGCVAPNTNNSGITSLQGIFSKIGENLTSARLIPNTTS